LSETKSGSGDAVIIKKYANRRLYNTQTSSYVTLDHLCEMVKEGVEFEVRDARTGEDITRSVLTQIIVEEEGKGQNLLPIKFLRQLIGFYGDNLQAFVPRYLEMSLDSFSRNQEEMREKFADSFSGLGYKNFESAARQNMAMFENAMKMFSPLAQGATRGPEHEPPPQNARGRTNGGPAQKTSSGREEEIRDLKDQIETMRRQIAELAERK
jgi:polyhydroxyalkanoate synthesis repressor PhaR